MIEQRRPEELSFVLGDVLGYRLSSNGQLKGDQDPAATAAVVVQDRLRALHEYAREECSFECAEVIQALWPGGLY